MIKDFRNSEARMKFIQNSSKKIKNINENWKKKIMRMKNDKLAMLIELRENQNEEINKKNLLTEKLLKENREKKQNQLRETQEKNRNAVESQQDKIEDIQFENEKERLEIEKKIMERIKKISENNKKNLEQKQSHFEEKIAQSVRLFKTNYENVLTKYDEKLHQSIEKPVLKYEKWVVLLCKISI